LLFKVSQRGENSQAEGVDVITAVPRGLTGPVLSILGFWNVRGNRSRHRLIARTRLMRYPAIENKEP